MIRGQRKVRKSLSARWGRFIRSIPHNRLWVAFGGAVYIRILQPRKWVEIPDAGLDRREARVYIRFSELIRGGPLSGTTAISVPRLGMFGNAFAAFMPVIARAMFYSIEHVIVHNDSVLSSGDEFGRRGVFELESGLTLWLDSEPERRQNRVGALISDKTLTWAPDLASGTRAWSEMGTLLTENATTKCLPEKTLAIHLRGGDVYRGNRILVNHGQPPLAYYQLVLDQKPWEHVLIVHQGTDMPVLAPLVRECEHRGIPITTQSATLIEDLRSLLAASAIAAGRGSFVPQIVGLSKCVKTVYMFDSGFGLAVPKSGLSIFRVVDVVGKYRESILSHNWENSTEQRRLQVEYPLAALAMERVA